MFSEKAIISKWVADVYDKNETDTDDVDFLLSAIGQAPKRILEVCCGSGRILVPLAKEGHIITGFDADEFMLAKIKMKAAGLENIQWHMADAVRDEWGAGFDVVVLAGNILYNIVSDMEYDKAQELFIKKAASALVPGGLLYIEYSPGGHFLTQPRKTVRSADDRVVWNDSDSSGNHGKMILIAGEYDEVSRLDRFIRRFELTLMNGDQIVQDISCEKHFATLEQIHGWLSSSGFRIEQEYGDYEQNPIDDDSTKVIIVAKKG